MAYSIQYGRRIQRKKKGDHRKFLAVTALLLAILLRMIGQSYLDSVQSLLFGEGEAVAVFYEDFVKH